MGYMPVKIEDVITKTKVPFDLYSKDGVKVCSEGEPINKDVVEKLQSFELFQKIERKKLSESEIVHIEGIKSCISQETTDFVISTAQSFLNILDPEEEEGGKLDVNACKESRDMLVSEVKENLHKGENIAALRIDAEYRYAHSINVLNLSVALAIQLGISEKDIQDLALAAMLADVGMAKVPKNIITKPTRLSVQEMAIVKEHPVLGFKCIMDEFGLPQKIALGALEHHERYDGTGYPRKIGLDSLSLFGQVIGICDTFDAMLSDRVYARAKIPKEAVVEILKSGRTYNPTLAHTLAFMVNLNTGNVNVTRKKTF